ncbi:NAD kinase [Erythrobacter sp. QSSC1-22B]|uniref:NAD kinase n=1 Tax=Erythrobacter sp. QSSC1-22B TaxID=1860125 RepID=UPI000804CA2A|nr:NAD kinase [Erythrobacter sp. QSSC1-22B]OBX20616.1 NAD kinase [Erythrobacter sp. QSSC1-22B]
MPNFEKLALIVSDTDRAHEVAPMYRGLADWVPLEEAEAVVVIGGDGAMLQTLHAMLDCGIIKPVYGVNLGTVGFLMNHNRSPEKLLRRIERARSVAVAPLCMEAVRQDGSTQEFCAINEVSLLRETRQTAKIEVSVDDKVRIKELVCDGVLVATPAGSTAYNLSANGPILPLDSSLLALTPISPFRPRRWRGALLPDRSTIRFRVLESNKRPVSVVADQKEVRDIAEVSLHIAREQELQLLFDPGHALDERIVAEQFLV